MNRHTWIGSALVALCLLAPGLSQAYTKYDDPFTLQPYVSQPAEAIKKGLQQYQWTVLKETPGKIEAQLSHKGHELRLDIFYNASKIWFEAVSAQNLSCKKAPCKVEPRHLTNWRVGLRRGIAYQLTLLALEDAKARAN